MSQADGGSLLQLHQTPQIGSNASATSASNPALLSTRRTASRTGYKKNYSTATVVPVSASVLDQSNSHDQQLPPTHPHPHHASAHPHRSTWTEGNAAHLQKHPHEHSHPQPIHKMNDLFPLSHQQLHQNQVQASLQDLSVRMPDKLPSSPTVRNILFLSVLLCLFLSSILYRAFTQPVPLVSSTHVFTTAGWLFHLVAMLLFLISSFLVFIRASIYFGSTLVTIVLSLLCHFISVILHTSRLETTSGIYAFDSVSISLLLQWLGCIVYYIVVCFLLYNAAAKKHIELPSQDVRNKHEIMMEIKELQAKIDQQKEIQRKKNEMNDTVVPFDHAIQIQEPDNKQHTGLTPTNTRPPSTQPPTNALNSNANTPDLIQPIHHQHHQSNSLPAPIPSEVTNISPFVPDDHVIEMEPLGVNEEEKKTTTEVPTHDRTPSLLGLQPPVEEQKKDHVIQVSPDDETEVHPFSTNNIASPARMQPTRGFDDEDDEDDGLGLERNESPMKGVMYYSVTNTPQQPPRKPAYPSTEPRPLPSSFQNKLEASQNNDGPNTFRSQVVQRIDDDE